MHIHEYSDILRHNQANSEVILVHSEPCVTVTYLQPWHIQNPGIFRTPATGLEPTTTLFVNETGLHSSPVAVT